MYRIQKSKIDDVVRLSGVSRSTVDRVLNGRNGVRKETAAKVEKALKALKYHESSLKKRITENAGDVEILYTEGSNPFFQSIHDAFEDVQTDLEMLGYSSRLKGFDAYQPDTLVKALKSVPKSTTHIIMVGIDIPEVVREIDNLTDRGVQVITVISDVPMSSRSDYIGQDNFGTGRLAGSLMSKMVKGTNCPVAVITGHLQFRHLLDRQSGFLQILGTERPDLVLVQTLPYGSDQERGRAIIADLFQKHPDLGGLYVAGGGQPSVIDAIGEFRSPDFVTIGHELNPATRKALRENVYTLVLAQDTSRLADACVKVINGKPIPSGRCNDVSIILKENLV